MAEWRRAPEVEEIARQLIGKYHTHLAEARILYLFREGKWSSQDRTTWGKAVKVSDRDRYIHGYDFLVIINEEVWHELDEPAREALVDHELSHCGQKENGTWCVWGHDLEDFAAVVRRHGLWNENVRRYLKAAERRKDNEDPKQPRLFDGWDEHAEAPKESENVWSA